MTAWTRQRENTTEEFEKSNRSSSKRDIFPVEKDLFNFERFRLSQGFTVISSRSFHRLFLFNYRVI